MTPEQFERVKRLFDAAMEMPEEQRGVFLDRECGDDSGVRAEVERLLRLESFQGLGEAVTFVKPPEFIGPYRVVTKLGEGGMGVVWKAFDEALQRPVAVKTLRAELLEDEESKRRFIREARAAAAINHPNVATIHQIGEAQGATFIAMEYVSGDKLRSRMGHEPLEIDDALDVAIQVAEGLSCAHRKGIVHRDLKPDNVMIGPDDRVKILDFGLAKLLERQFCPDGSVARHIDSLSVKLTIKAQIVGTAAYMSPEQAMDKVVDSRSDLFSFGAMLYEMVTAKRPFSGESFLETLEAIAHETPVPVTQLNRRVPAALEQIVARCLEKDPDERYQSAKELAADLRRLREKKFPAARRFRVGLSVKAAAALVLTGVALLAAGYWLREGITTSGVRPTGRVMLAVLPFENTSGTPEWEYIGDGMTEELISQLGSLNPNRLGVIARTSSMQFKNTDKSIDEIGRELGVDKLIEGSVRRADRHVRISSQLVQVSDQTTIWANTYDGDLENVLAVQSGVAEKIAGEVAIQLGLQQTRAVRSHAVDPAAYDAYLRGRHHVNTRTAESLRRGIEHFLTAAEVDPDYPLSYAGLAGAYSLLGYYHVLAPRHAFPKAKTFALKALDLDESLAEAHASLALVEHIYEWDWSAAESGFQRAIAINPSYAEAHHWYAVHLATLGRFDEALAEIKRARTLDPLALRISTGAAYYLYFARRYEETIEQCLKTLELEPNYPIAHATLGLAYQQTGQHEKALAAFQRAISHSEGTTSLIGALAHGFARAGNRADALDTLDELRARSERQYVDLAFFNAAVYTALGEHDQALDWLETAYEGRSSWLVQLKVSPWFDPLRAEPAFQDLLRRMNFPDDRGAAATEPRSTTF